MLQIELACKDVVFHFNKKHLEDQTIPMWVLKTQGETYYVNHVSCMLPWSTKETPDNPHTKGSIKVKDCLLQIDDENEATIKELTTHDKTRLKNAKLGITRVIVSEKNFGGHKLREALKNQKAKHGPIKSIGGACTTTFFVTDIFDKKAMTFLSIALAGTDFRELMPNEGYYKLYDDPKYQDKDYIDEDELYYDDVDSEDEDS